MILILIVKENSPTSKGENIMIYNKIFLDKMLSERFTNYNISQILSDSLFEFNSQT